MSNLANTGDTVNQFIPQLAGSHAMATLGKTSAALILVIATIWLFSYLLKRFNNYSGISEKTIRVVSATSVGQRERVVVVEIQKTWLVLGVGSGQISKLHSLAAPTSESSDTKSPTESDDSFAQRMMKIRNRNPAQ